MITLIFVITFGSWFTVSAYFIHRFVLHRLGPKKRWNWPSLVCAVAPIGWIVAPARELHWLPRWGASPLLALSFAIGLLALLIIANFERQAPRD